MSLATGTTEATILVVEDEPLLLAFIRRHLEGAGFTVLSATHAEEGMRTDATFSGEIHLLLVSLTMPMTASGVDLAIKVEGRRPGLRVMLMSGYAEGSMLAAIHGWRFISKPFDPRALVNSVKAFLVASVMGDGQRYETEWENLRIVIERRPEHWQAFVYDAERCEVLFAAERMTAEAAKVTALDFALVHRYGPSHDLEPGVVAEMLVWRSGVGHAP